MRAGLRRRRPSQADTVPVPASHAGSRAARHIIAAAGGSTGVAVRIPLEAARDAPHQAFRLTAPAFEHRPGLTSAWRLACVARSQSGERLPHPSPDPLARPGRHRRRQLSREHSRSRSATRICRCGVVWALALGGCTRRLKTGRRERRRGLWSPSTRAVRCLWIADVERHESPESSEFLAYSLVDSDAPASALEVGESTIGAHGACGV